MNRLDPFEEGEESDGETVPPPPPPPQPPGPALAQPTPAPLQDKVPVIVAVLLPVN